MAVDQRQFDDDLNALVKVLTDLIAAIEAWIVAHPPGVDLSAEDQAVRDAAAAATAELEKLSTPPPDQPDA